MRSGAWLTGDRTLFVALAAMAWGLDGLLRQPLAFAIAPATVVFWEHLIVTILVLPLLPRAIRAFVRAGVRDRFAVILIGVGASAVATTLFTKAFAIAAADRDYITPLVLQKLQPVMAVALAVVLLKERLRPRFGFYALPALIGAWLLSFREPFDVTVSSAAAALLAVGAAALWASGTVLGRLVSPSFTPVELTTLRFAIGLLAMSVLAPMSGAPLSVSGTAIWPLALLALIPGLGALCLYYYGLSRTAASRATFAELAFPATAAVIGVVFLGSELNTSQWIGLGILAGAVVGLGWNESTRKQAVLDASLPEPVG